MVDNSRVILEDEEEYQVVDKIKDKKCSYVYLLNFRDKEDLVIRKEIIEEDETRYLIGLDDEKELEKALNLYMEKNNIK